MGIPKFYRWLSERYPLLNMSVAATEAPPEIDNIYLDMNGIIHNCTHANDPNLKLTETEMVVRIFTYLDKLIQIIKPQKLVFMAIDGVAPRAKMNQQRARRFKSAKEREAREAEMKARGEEIDPATHFDSNCITPGTPFMDRLGRHLRFFIRRKMAEDPVWQKPNVIFSGHEVPGEGEHKIMEYIRWQKLQPGYAPNQRHCMYGLDADLIMLSLVTHEPHFCLLREVVMFTGRARGQPTRETLENPCAENFILFQIGLLREYFEVEFGLIDPLPWAPDGAVDVERVVDDFVLFCMLVGNDFLPALPTMDIAEGGLNKLFEMYKEALPKLGGYLTDAGDLHHGRLEVLFKRLAEVEMDTLQERAEDTEWFENKRQKRRGGGGGSGAGGGGDGTGGSLAAGGSSGLLAPLQRQAPSDPSLATLAGALLDPLMGAALEEDDEEEKPQEPTMMSKEARAMFLAGEGDAALEAWKNRYYREKLEMPDGQRRAVSEEYIKGLHWVLQYYYRGVASWDWFYPYHYAPMASELYALSSIQVSFTPGKPFLPYEQLLAVQPPASCTLLPEAYWPLMTSPNSPIRDFYPIKFDIDMEGKRAEWEGIVKIPFISEDRLLEAAGSVRPETLTADERRRNSHGDVLVFQYIHGRHEAEHCESTLPRWGATVHHAHSSCRHVPAPPPLPPAQLGFRPLLIKGTQTGKKNPPGFPTLKTMKLLGAELKNAGVNVFGNASKKESLVLTLPDIHQVLGASTDASAVASMIGERVYVKWPYLQEAQIVRVSDQGQELAAKGRRQHSKEEADQWSSLSGRTRNLFLTKQGVETGPLPVMLHVRPCTGYVRHADGSVVKQFMTEEAPYPLQAVLRQRPRAPAGFHDPDQPRPVELQEGARVLFLGADHYGAVATLLPDPGRGVGPDGRRLPALVSGSGAHACVRVTQARHDAAAAAKLAKQVVKEYPVQYMPSGTASRMLRINPRLLGRITGNVWVGDGENRADVGLAVKNAKQGMCVPGLACPLPDDSGWSYSNTLIDLVADYRARFPWVFASLESTNEQRMTVELLVPPSLAATPGERSAKLAEVTSWLKGLPTAKRPLVKTGVQVASDRAIEVLMASVPPLAPRGSSLLPVDYENVAEQLLLPPYDPSRPLSTLLGGDMELGDRVSVARGSGSPPFGLRGTVVGVFEAAVELLMDDEFAGGTTLNGRLRLARGATVPKDQVLNITKQHRIHLPTKQDLPRRMHQQTSAGVAAATAAAAAHALQQAQRPQGDGEDHDANDHDTGRPAPLVALAPWCKGRMPSKAQPQAIAPAALEPEPEPQHAQQQPQRQQQQPQRQQRSEAQPAVTAAGASGGAAPPPPARLLQQVGSRRSSGSGGYDHPGPTPQYHQQQPQPPSTQLNWQQQQLLQHLQPRQPMASQQQQQQQPPPPPQLQRSASSGHQYQPPPPQQQQHQRAPAASPDLLQMLHRRQPAPPAQQQPPPPPQRQHSQGPFSPDQYVIQQPVRQQPVRQQPAIQQPVRQQPVIQQPVRQQPAIQQPVRQQPVIQQPVIQQPMRQQPVIQQPMRQQPHFPGSYQQQHPVPQQQLTWQQQQYYSHPGQQPVPPQPAQQAPPPPQRKQQPAQGHPPLTAPNAQNSSSGGGARHVNRVSSSGAAAAAAPPAAAGSGDLDGAGAASGRKKKRSKKKSGGGASEDGAGAAAAPAAAAPAAAAAADSAGGAARAGKGAKKKGKAAAPAAGGDGSRDAGVAAAPMAAGGAIAAAISCSPDGRLSLRLTVGGAAAGPTAESATEGPAPSLVAAPQLPLIRASPGGASDAAPAVEGAPASVGEPAVRLTLRVSGAGAVEAEVRPSGEAAAASDAAVGATAGPGAAAAESPSAPAAAAVAVAASPVASSPSGSSSGLLKRMGGFFSQLSGKKKKDKETKKEVTQEAKEVTQEAKAATLEKDEDAEGVKEALDVAAPQGQDGLQPQEAPATVAPAEPTEPADLLPEAAAAVEAAPGPELLPVEAASERASKVSEAAAAEAEAAAGVAPDEAAGKQLPDLPPPITQRSLSLTLLVQESQEVSACIRLEAASGAEAAQPAADVSLAPGPEKLPAPAPQAHGVSPEAPAAAPAEPRPRGSSAGGHESPLPSSPLAGRAGAIGAGATVRPARGGIGVPKAAVKDVPKMPDGSRGFIWVGRGRGASPPFELGTQLPAPGSGAGALAAPSPLSTRAGGGAAAPGTAVSAPTSPFATAGAAGLGRAPRSAPGTPPGFGAAAVASSGAAPLAPEGNGAQPDAAAKGGAILQLLRAASQKQQQEQPHAPAPAAGMMLLSQLQGASSAQQQYPAPAPAQPQAPRPQLLQLLSNAAINHNQATVAAAAPAAAATPAPAAAPAPVGAQLLMALLRASDKQKHGQ